MNRLCTPFFSFRGRSTLPVVLNKVKVLGMSEPINLKKSVSSPYEP